MSVIRLLVCGGTRPVPPAGAPYAATPRHRAPVSGWNTGHVVSVRGWRPALGIDMDTLEKKYELSREVMGYH
jgi:hypothetical protein